MSTINETVGVHPHLQPQIWGILKTWMARRRIAISLTCFTVLIVFNLTIVGARPENPFALWQWKSALGLALIVGGLAIRSWSAGTLHKFEQLTTIGPYALVRNPLYVGSFLMMYGFALIMTDWLSILFISGPMAMLYYFQVRHEEKALLSHFPTQWLVYIQQTPRFIPYKFNSKWRSGWSGAQWLRNREYQAIFGATLGLIGLAVLRAIGG
jgi:protein-S-isoprenylcysteine O-methyltransferase Ste14